MKATDRLGHLIVAAVLLAVLAPGAIAQLIPSYEIQKDERWQYQFNLFFADISDEPLDTSRIGFQLRLPDYYKERMFGVQKKDRFWHPFWSIMYMKAEGQIYGGPYTVATPTGPVLRNLATWVEEAQISAAFFGADNVRPGSRFYVTGAVGLYFIDQKDATLTDATNQVYDLKTTTEWQMGGYLGAGWKMGPKKDRVVELTRHYFEGNSMTMLAAGYRW